jgi:glycerophosphoryl diester phosphodiesterase
VLNEEAVKKAKALGLRIIPWTVNEPGDIARVLALGVDGIISDYPDRVQAELKRRAR